MRKLNASDKIYIKESVISGAGRGVFAKRDIKKGEIIERCPVIEIPPSDTANLTDSILVTYFYYLGPQKDRVFITLGFGAIYNHTYAPNAIYKEKLEEEIVEFVAIEDISKDQEITVNYNPEKSEDKNPLWFE
jgi:uncharacterized protein